MATAAIPTLRDGDVTLRPIRARDAKVLERVLLDNRSWLRQWEATYPGGGTVIDTRASIRNLLAHARTGHALPFVIEVDGETAGMIQYADLGDEDFRHAAIDLFLAEGFRGRGLGRESIEVLIRHLTNDRGHHRLIIDPAVANERAVRCYEAVGFRRVGVMRRYQRMADGHWEDGLLMEFVQD